MINYLCQQRQKQTTKLLQVNEMENNSLTLFTLSLYNCYMDNTEKSSIRTWNLADLFEKDDDPAIEKYKRSIEAAYKKFINDWKNRTDYLENPSVLKTALDEYELLVREYGGGGKLGYYLSLRTSQDSLNTNLKAEENKFDQFIQELDNEIMFFTHNIAKISPEEQPKFLEHESLSPYKHFLKQAFDSAKYLLSEPEEKILNLLSGPSHSSWTRMTDTFLSKEELETLNEDGSKSLKNFSQILGLINNNNKSVRDDAANALNEILEKHADAGENELNAIMQTKKISDELRKINRPDLVRHISDDIESEIVDQLIKVTSDSFEISKEFYKLKAQILNVPKLAYHERNISVSTTSQKYTYDESLNLVLKSFRNLDEEFYTIAEKLNHNGYIDVFPKKGKRSGAFCAYFNPNTPTYVLLNHTDELKDVLTIAHEFGHAINNELMKKKQNALNFGTPLATAEVSSTFMEDFVLEEILKEADDELRFSILMDKLNDDVSTIFRQVAFYKFEWDLHREFREKGYLSKDEIGQLFQDHMKAYMGDYVDHPDTSKNWWLFVNHFRYFFYVYSYASGLLISKSLQGSVKKDKEFISKVKDFMSEGESKSPKDIFMNLGIDISQEDFWKVGIEEIKTLLEETKTLARELGKIS